MTAQHDGGHGAGVEQRTEAAAGEHRGRGTHLLRPRGVRVVVVDAGWQDPTHQAAEVVQGDPRAVCEALAAALDAAIGTKAEPKSTFAAHPSAA